MLFIIVFIHTLLPVPVAPAISKCGIDAKSAIIGFPEISFPRPIAILPLKLLISLDSRTSFKYIVSLVMFGISIPTSPRPGIGACILMLLAFMASARSSDSAWNLFTFTPGAGSISYCVIMGPIFTFLTSAFTPNSANLSINISLILFIFSCISSLSSFDG